MNGQCKNCAFYDGELQNPDGWCLLNQKLIEGTMEEACDDFEGIERRWFIIGLHLYVYPPVHDFKKMSDWRNWKPEKKGIMETLKFRWRRGIWSIAAYCDDTGARPKYSKISE